jgi:murein DD-endopeptidase MepM/ murein hydrolase activator NlpD
MRALYWLIVNTLGFFKHFVFYTVRRSRQAVMFSTAWANLATLWFTGLKEEVVRRTFWGRSNLYKTLFHVIIGIVTLIIGLGGIVNRLNFINEDSASTAFASEGLGYTDVLGQANVTRTIVPDDSIRNNAVDKITYIVRGGDTLSSIADEHGISVDTIKWANDLTEDTISPGQELIIFRHSGVLHVVEDGDTLDSIAEEYSNNDQVISTQVIAQVNWLEPPFVLTGGMELFIPNGTIAPPVSTTTVIATDPVGQSEPVPNFVPTPEGTGVATGTFIHPVSGCSGYVSQWYWAWHTAIDYASSGSASCPIYAADGGVVTTAGWTYGGGGFCVNIDHGNGFASGYCHGNGEFSVSAGQTVSQGQHIMNMGASGIATGVHVHFYMTYNGGSVNPAAYVAF